jgi:hypothetical protein
MALMAVYALLLVAANRLVPMAGSPALKLAYAILPAIPVIGVFVVMGRHVVALRDEYQRMLLVRKMLIATAFLLGVATAWGFAEDFDVVPHVPAFYAVILWFGGLGIGGCVNAWLERGESGQ